jgi:hypothetical protein
MDPGSHPSFLELDRTALGQGAPETVAHAKSCERCQAHLRKLEAPVAVPAWARELGQPKPARQPNWWTLALFGAAAAGAAAVFLLFPAPVSQQPSLPGSLVASKGTPAVALYVKRGEQVTLWDGHAPVQAGDRLQIEVAGEGFSQLLIATPGGFAKPLFQGALDAKHSTLVPQSWRVDQSPGPETLDIVISVGALSAEEASAAVSAHRRDAKVWTTELTLPKATP